MAAKGLRYLSYPPGSGYGEAAEDYITLLRAAGVPVSWTPLAWGAGSEGLQELAPFEGTDFGPFRHNDICNLPIDAATVLVHSPPLWYEPWSRRGEQPRRITYTTYETDRLPERHVRTLNRYDAVLVPSQHNREAFIRSGVISPLRVIPHVARPARRVQGERLSSLNPELFVFYAINTWTARKALPETILAFLKAFSAEDPVALVVKTSALDHVAFERSRGAGGAVLSQPSPHEGLAWWSLAQLLSEHRNPPRIHLIAGEEPRRTIDELHTRGDCFVSLARGEGWGLGPFEAAAYGNPVVVTGWGGHLDYLPPDYPYCVDYRLVPASDDEPDDWFTPGPDERWARADVSHASALLRSIYEGQEAARARGAELGRFVAGNFAPARVGDQLVSTVREFADG